MTVRRTVHLDGELLARARRLAPPRGLSHLVNEALTEKVQALERQQTELAMREGYAATDSEQAELDRDWDAASREDWPE